MYKPHHQKTLALGSAAEGEQEDSIHLLWPLERIIVSL